MSPVFPARRRAEEFDTLISQGVPTPADSRTRELVGLVSAMRTLGEPGARPEPRPEFVTELRSNLMAAAAAELAQVQTPAEVADQLTVGPRTRTEKRLTAALAGFAMVGASATMAVASQGALPGDALYPIKRALEDASTGISLNDSQKGARLLGNATDRLHELDRLIADGQADTAAVADTLATFRDQADEGAALLLDDYRATGSIGSAEQVLAFTASGIERLAELDAEVPTEARPAIADSAELLFRLDAEAKQLCVLCSGGITDVPSGLIPVAAEEPAAAPGTTVVPEDTGQPVETAPTELPSVDPEELPGSVSTVAPSGQPDAGAGTGAPGVPLPSVTEGGDATVENPLQDPEAPLASATSTIGDLIDDTVDGTSDGLDEVLPGAGTAVDGTVGGVEELLCTTTQVCLGGTESGSGGLLGGG